eukprot:TRINITY_DN30821_c0_g1_i2.p1 TRINITY_DN30821_c0_g1~~TRINITY_DN30821_c0_g1_i2.p1  ORF type:complete len:898 (+),score=116.40 TRINITY_DN30821_c0_g1_i2:338-2695(+)
MCISVPAGRAYHGAPLELGRCGNPRFGDGQLFTFSDSGGKVQLASNPKLCMDVKDHGNYNGCPVQLWDCIDTDSDQTFLFSTSETEGGKIHWSGHRGKCVDVKDHRTDEGTPIQIWECMHGDSDQRFSSASACDMQAADAEKRPLSSAPSRQIRWSNHPNHCLSVLDADPHGGSPVQLEACCAAERQQFQFSEHGLVRFAPKPNLCLDVRHFFDADGTMLQLWKCLEGSRGQLFDFRDNRLKWTLHPDKCVDVKDHHTAEGTQMQIWDCIDKDTDQDFFAQADSTKVFETTTTTTTTLPKIPGIEVLQSSPDGYWKEHRVAFGPMNKKDETVQVETTLLDQTIIGFGGAITEASAVVFDQMSENLKQEILDSYYGEQGLNYNLGRVHINSCDFSTGSYDFDSVKDDFELAHFDEEVSRDKDVLIPLIKRVQMHARTARNELLLLASPWSPPAWMKTNGKMVHSDSPGLKEECQDVWARYISKWISAYHRQDIPIWAITIQNEPMANSRWEACVYSGQYEGEFLADHLGPTIRKDHPDIAMFAFDHNKGEMNDFVSGVTKNSKASSYMSGVAFHWYGGDHFDAVKDLHQRFPDKMMLATEATYERYRLPPKLQAYLGNAGDHAFGLGYAHDILGDLNAGAVGWIDWNILLDPHGGPNHVGNTCDAAIIADSKTQKIWKHPQYYAIGHFSKFMPPGSRIAKTAVKGSWKFSNSWSRPYGVCNAADGLQATSAVRPDGKLAVVVLNCGGKARTFNLQINGQSFVLRGVIAGQAIQSYLIAKKFTMSPE